MLRYNRFLSDNAFKFLKNQGAFIIPEILNARPINCPFKFDVQIRENDLLIVYVGTTKVLNIKISKGFVTFSAHKTYQDDFLKKYSIIDLPIGEIAKYLSRIISKVNSRYFDNHKEGYFQNYLCYYLGEFESKDAPFFIFDRECVLGFDNSDDKTKHLQPFKSKYENIRTDLQQTNNWGVSKLKSLGDELDMLAIDYNCNLICIELKHSSNGSGIFWAPLQVSLYRDAFKSAINQDIFESIKKIISQKAKLGLLPEFVNSIMNKKNSFNKIISLVAVGGEVNKKMKCWSRFEEVCAKSPNDFQNQIFVFNENNLGKYMTVNNGELI